MAPKDPRLESARTRVKGKELVTPGTSAANDHSYNKMSLSQKPQLSDNVEAFHDIDFINTVTCNGCKNVVDSTRKLITCGFSENHYCITCSDLNHHTFEPLHDKTNKMACAPSKVSDQPGHPPSLIRVFAVRMKTLGS